MSIMEVPGQAVESHPYRDRVDELLVKMERLIKQDIDDDTARLYNGGMMSMKFAASASSLLTGLKAKTE